jgi:hypothetical protein
MPAPAVRLRVEHLELRHTPATLVSPTTLTYQDADADHVTVTFSKAILNADEVNDVFTFDTGNVTVPGDNTVRQQLRTINLSLPGLLAAGTNVTVTAVPSATTGGDGFAAVGQIDATDIDLGKVTIDGDLGRILAGDAATATPGLVGLTVRSLGRYGAHTGVADLTSTVQGALESLRVGTDVQGAAVLVTGGQDGRIGSVFVGGSLIGAATRQSGSIIAEGNLGPVTIHGDLIGGAGNNSGEVAGNQEVAVTVGGSVRGGGGTESGGLHFLSGGGPVAIQGDLAGGIGLDSGQVSVDNDRLPRVTIGGSIRGGAGLGSGVILAISPTESASLGSVVVRGDILGGTGNQAGSVEAGAGLAGLTVGGSVRGGSGNVTGAITVNGPAGAISIGGNLVGGSAGGTANLDDSGFIKTGAMKSLTIGGSVIAGTDFTSGTFRDNGAIRADGPIGTVLIKGGIVGNPSNSAVLSAVGDVRPTATTNVAIGRLTVLWGVEFAQILAGVDSNGLSRNADAQVGPVVVVGDWIASNLVAGAVAGPDGVFGDGDDAKPSGGLVQDDPLVPSKIASLTIGGQVLGTFGGTDRFAIVAEAIGRVTIGGTALPLTGGKDEKLLGITGDFVVREI